MLRVQRSLKNIDKTYLTSLMMSIHALVKEYESLHSTIFTKDATTLNEMHHIEELEKSSTQPPVTYYLILKNLFDTLMAAKARKHGEEKPILALHRLLTDELRDLEEAQLEHPGDPANIDASLDGALQRLVKYTHTMRDRTTLTDEYLARLLREIKQRTTEYEKLLRHRSKEHDTVTMLKKIALPDKPRNVLDAYCHVLKKLHLTLRASKNASTNPSLQALHKLLVLELQTQAEAEWSAPCENNGFRNDSATIASSLQNIDDHSFYSSKKEKDFCERWSISSAHLAIGVADKWKAVCELGLGQKDAGLQQSVNHAITMLGFTNDQFSAHENEKLFALQKDNPFARKVRELEGERRSLMDTLRDRKKEAQKKRDKNSEEFRDLQQRIDDAQTNLSIIDDNIRNNTIKSLDYQVSVFPLESDTLHQLTETILLFSKNMAAFIIENMLRERAQTGGKLSEQDIQHGAKVYYLFLSKLQTLHVPIVNEYNRINAALARRVEIAYEGRGELETAKAKGAIVFHTVPVFPKLEFTHNLEENQALLTSGDDDYYNFKKFLTSSFSSLETREEFQMALDSLIPQANMNKLYDQDFTVSEKYHVTFMSQHKINSMAANMETVAQPQEKVDTSQAPLQPAITSPLPESARVSFSSEIPFASSEDSDHHSAKSEGDIETYSQSSSPRPATTTDDSGFEPVRKPSLSEVVLDFVANDASKRPRPTWQKIGIGLLIGLGAGLVAGGIAAATLFTGGVALGVVIGVSVGLLVAGVTTGGIGGKIHDYRTRPVEATQPALKRRSSSADIQSQLEHNVAKRVKAVNFISADKPRDEYSAAKSQFSQFVQKRGFAIPTGASTSQPQSASQGGQSPRL